MALNPSRTKKDERNWIGINKNNNKTRKADSNKISIRYKQQHYFEHTRNDEIYTIDERLGN
jgi:hypothetical protein